MLHLAAQRGNVPVVEYLACAARVSNINHSDRRGRTGVHYGVENKRAGYTITALVSHGADLWARDRHERSALHHAAKLGNLPAVKALLALGMAVELRAADCFGMTPLKIAAHHEAHAVLAFLARMESSMEWGEHLTWPGLCEYEDLAIAATDNSFGRSLSTPTQIRCDPLPVRTRLRCQNEGGWKILSRCRLSNLNACHGVIRCLVVAIAMWTMSVFLFR